MNELAEVEELQRLLRHRTKQLEDIRRKLKNVRRASKEHMAEVQQKVREWQQQLLNDQRDLNSVVNEAIERQIRLGLLSRTNQANNRE